MTATRVFVVLYGVRGPIETASPVLRRAGRARSVRVRVRRFGALRRAGRGAGGLPAPRPLRPARPQALPADARAGRRQRVAEPAPTDTQKNVQNSQKLRIKKNCCVE